MNRSGFILFALLTVAARAEAPPDPHSPPPPPPRIMPAAPLQNGWHSIQPDLDRGAARITPDAVHTLNQIDSSSLRPFDQLQADRDRQLQIDQQNRNIENDQRRQTQFANEAQRRQELDRREYSLFLHAGLSDVSLQVLADEQALNQAKNTRDTQLINAQNALIDAERSHPDHRPALEQAYQQQANQIRAGYDTERARILGVGPVAAPATQPGS